jgi:dihydroorotase
MDILIKNATIVHAGHSHHMQKRDIKIEKGIISSIRKSIKQKDSEQIIEGKSIHVCIGLCDIGTHSGEPGYEHRENIQSLTKAALKGGYTALAIFPNAKPITQTKADINFIKNHSNTNGVILYPIGALSKDTKGVDIAEYIDMYHAGAVGFSDGMNSIADSGLLSRSLQYAAQVSAPIIHHPHNALLAAGGEIHEGLTSTSMGMKGIPSICEIQPVQRDILIANYTNGRIIEHAISAEESVELIKKAQKAGTNIAATVSYMNLLHTDEDMLDFDTNLKVSPVLRSMSDRKALIKGVNESTISAIVSNHTPLDEESKNLEFTYADFGAIGLETCLIACIDKLSKEINLDILIHQLTIGPRQILGLPIPSFGEGYPANICVFDLGETTTINIETVISKSKNTPYLNQSFGAKVVAVIC